jgi:hypothetical protein
VEHLVKFTSAEGRDGFHTATGLDEALKFVERLRNNEDVEHVSVYRLQEVPIEFKAYYKVELRGAESSSGNPEEAAEPAAESLPVPGSPSEEEEPGLVGAPAGAPDGNRRLFGRS